MSVQHRKLLIPRPDLLHVFVELHLKGVINVSRGIIQKVLTLLTEVHSTLHPASPREEDVRLSERQGLLYLRMGFVQEVLVSKPWGFRTKQKETGDK